ncbi:MAG: prenyltransferase/squalene oxidase repeat-containing protein [Pirellulaceae bacterium]
MEHRDGKKKPSQTRKTLDTPLGLPAELPVHPSAADFPDELTLQPLDEFEPFEVLPEDETESGFQLVDEEETVVGIGGEELADFAKMDFGDDLPTGVSPLDSTAGFSFFSPQSSSTPGPQMVGAELVPAEVVAEPPHVTHVEAAIAEEPEPALAGRTHRKFLLTTAPSWLISLLVHVAIILILAAITLDPVNKVISILQASSSEDISDIENFDLQGPTLDAVETPVDEPLSVPTASITPVVSVPKLESPMLPDVAADIEALEMNSLTESIMPSSLLNSSAMAQMSVALNSRSNAQKSEMLEKFGGNAASEKAVAMALKWIADHQDRSGGWTFAHNTVCRNQCDHPGELAEANNGATAMALLPFLGAGQTHMEGQYKATVEAGLAYLIKHMKLENKGLPQGSWHEPGGSMYSHGLAAITVCEAYAMTGDPKLLQPAQLSLNYLINAQDPRGGGWRYSPGQPGDTSVVGWCVMALKSGKMGHLVVPQQTFYKASSFLDFVSTNQGAYYGYDEPSGTVRDATTAVGLLCRMYLGTPKEHPGIQEGVAYLSQKGPSISNLYYSYYATQVMRHNGGPEWEKWNTQLRDKLLEIQVKDGHAAGSWYTEGGHSEKGGRLYTTSLATMILEVYYRHMPLYKEKSSLDDFEL